MGWEDVPVQVHNGGFFDAISADDVSIVTSKVKNSVIFRINVMRTNFKEHTFVKLRIDRERKRVGFFVCKPEEGRKICGYGKTSRLVYVSCPKVLQEIGFTKGRYTLTRPNAEKNPDMFFYVKLEDKKKEPISEVIKEKEED